MLHADMSHGRNCLVFSLIYFSTVCFGNQVNVYNYEGHIDTKTTADPDYIARWTIKAKLSDVQSPESDLLFVKLDDIKISLFNGKISDLNNVNEKEIPEEAKIIEQSFAIKLNTTNSKFDLLFKPNEPLWSINMKRGIADFLKFEYGAPTGNPEENTLFGRCRVTYTKESATVDNELVKKLNNFDCTDEAIETMTNKESAPGIKGLPDVLSFNYNKKMSLSHQNKSLYSLVNVVYKTSPTALYTLNIDQEQKLTFVEKHDLEETIDPAQYSNKKGIIYEWGNDLFGGRRVFDTNPELVKKYMKHYDEFKEIFSYAPIKMDTGTYKTLNDMKNVLEKIDFEEVEKIQKLLNAEEKDLFMSILGYIGTNETVKYLTEFYKTEKVNANAGFATWILVTFPQYIQHPSEELLKNMEQLISNPEAKYKMTKHAAVFGFAAAVGRTCCIKNKGEKFWQKYVDLYYNNYLEGQNYELRMVYLLGLTNMAHCLDYNLIESILTNSSESHQLRVIAFNGFKIRLQHEENVDKIHQTFWPMVQNKSEPFDVRVVALDLLLSIKLTKKQFDSILQEYSKDLDEPEDLQFANYVITSLHSLQNITGYFDHLGALASAALKTTNIRPFPKAWATGFYRLSYTDSIPNFGAAFEARLITNPNTNIVNTIQLSFNSFADSFTHGTYNLYLKFEGVFQQNYIEDWLAKSKNSSLPQLLELLQKNNFQIKTQGGVFHVDVALFVDNIAVYANHFDESGKDQLVQNLSNDLKDLLLTSNYISFPLLNYVHIPSILGTPIWITNYRVNVEKHNLDNNIIRYRSSRNLQTCLEAYNPLIDANIAAYKYNFNEMHVRLNFTSKLEGFTSFFWKWVNEEDTFTYLWQKNMGTTVKDVEKLKEFCEKCEAFNEVALEEHSVVNYGYEEIGSDISVETYDHPNISSDGDILDELLVNKLHRINADAVSFAGPILFAANFYSFKFWLRSDLTKGLIRSSSSDRKKQNTQAEFNFSIKGSKGNRFRLSDELSLKTDLIVKNIHDEVTSKINLTGLYTWGPNYEDENETTPTSIRRVEFQFIFKSPYVYNSFKLCGHGSISFPKLRGDRLSLIPYENSTGEIHFTVGENVDDNKDCVPQYSGTIIEVFSTSEKFDRLKKDEEKCLSDSKDLKFVAPTKECVRAANRLTEYDNYQVTVEMIAHSEYGDEDLIPPGTGLFSYSHIEDKLRVNFTYLDSIAELDGLDSFSFELYYPHMIINPSWSSYSEDELVFPQLAHSTCTVTPSTVQKFSGKYVPNQNKEWFAFGECLNVSRRGLNGHTIDDKHVGFTFYSNENVVEANVEDGKPKIILNGGPFTKKDSNFMISFLDNNSVIYIKDDRVDIYYNTEYVYIKVKSLYLQALCGLCF